MRLVCALPANFLVGLGKLSPFSVDNFVGKLVAWPFTPGGGLSCLKMRQFMAPS